MKKQILLPLAASFAPALCGVLDTQVERTLAESSLESQIASQEQAKAVQELAAAMQAQAAADVVQALIAAALFVIVLAACASVVYAVFKLRISTGRQALPGPVSRAALPESDIYTIDHVQAADELENVLLRAWSDWGDDA